MKAAVAAEGVPLPPWKEEAAAFAEKVLCALGKDGEVSILFCGNAYIKELNARYRGLDEPTDILSFPQHEQELVPPLNHLLGDIVISLDALKENAEYFSVDEREELRRLIIHGILHLCGEDHTTNDSDEPMLQKQEKLLGELR